MPQQPLANPSGLSRRLRGLALGIPATVFLFVSLLLFNLLQTSSLLLRPFSAWAFRRFNRWCADTWWGWCVILSSLMNGTHLVVTGDEVPPRENAIVLSNHQQMPDITFLMIIARQKHRLGDMKWIVKDVIKYMPGVGWGMVFLDCVFVRRNWSADRASVERAFAHLVKGNVPLWLMSFPEGTRMTPAKLERARAYAQKEGLTPLRHLLVPRTKGFVASVQGLGNHVAAVYDLTLGYPTGVPTLWQYIQGFARQAHLHVRRFPLAELPQDEGQLAAWLMARFLEKDELLEAFYKDGAFPESEAGVKPAGACPRSRPARPA